jgi:hypothetical protein
MLVVQGSLPRPLLGQVRLLVLGQERMLVLVLRQVLGQVLGSPLPWPLLGQVLGLHRLHRLHRLRWRKAGSGCSGKAGAGRSEGLVCRTVSLRQVVPSLLHDPPPWFAIHGLVLLVSTGLFLCAEDNLASQDCMSVVPLAIRPGMLPKAFERQLRRLDRSARLG